MDERIDQIERLTRLRDAGALSATEFAAEKTRILREQQRAAFGRRAVPEPAPFFEPDPDEEEADEERGAIGGWLVLLGVVLLFAIGLAGALWGGAFDVPAIQPGAAPPDAGADRGAAGLPLAEASAAPTPSPTPAETDLGDTLTLADAGRCEWGEEAEQVFRQALVEEGERRKAPTLITVGGYPIKPAFVVTPDEAGGRTYESALRFPGTARWNGLRLSRMLVRQGVDPDTDGFNERRLTFLSPLAELTAALTKRKLTLPKGGKLEESGQCAGTIRATAVSGGSALVCRWSC